ncbi:MAG: hypothetical protein ACO1QR_07065 [Chthoniobacteraceae bacterium]
MDRKLAVRLLLAVAGVVLAALYFRLGGNPDAAPKSTQTPAGSPLHATPSPHVAVLENLRAELQSGQAGQPELEALRQRLLSLPPNQAIAEIRAFLASGKDTALRSEFEIGEGGALAGAPTLRVFLLDLLGQISRSSGSDAGAQLAREILETKSSPDEWALSLRNVAWHDPKAKPYLAGKMREMLAHEPWLQRPSDGFLEAFDVIVYTADPTFVPQLAELRENGPDDIQRAAAIAMDRLSEVAPLQVMTYLNANPSEFADLPMLRADFYAKANLAVPAERAALEVYLARQDVTHDEKAKLIRALATPTSFISDNLLTENPPPDDDLARLRHYGTVLQEWQAQGRFPQLQNEIAQMNGRIAAHLR